MGSVGDESGGLCDRKTLAGFQSVQGESFCLFFKFFKFFCVAGGNKLFIGFEPCLLIELGSKYVRI